MTPAIPQPTPETRTKPLRVAHVVRSLEIGGLERLVCDLVSESARFEPAVFCLTQLGPLGESLLAAGRSVTVVGMDRGPLHTLRRLWGQFRAFRPDVVHCHNLLAHLYGSIAARASGTHAIVFSKHGTHFPMRSLSGRLNALLLRYSHTVAVSEDIRLLCVRKLRLRNQSVSYIPNGLSLRPFANLPSRQEARRRLGWPTSDFHVGIVARLVLEKGHLVLLEAFQQFLRSVPHAKLVVIGDGPARPAIQEAVERLGLASAVLLTGARNDIPALLAALDVFALPSFDEGIPMTILEAMAAGLPVLATAVGGIPQVVLDGETGTLVPPRSPESIAKALSSLYRDSERTERMGVAGRNRVHAHFGSGGMVSRYEELYLKLLHRRR